MIKQVPFVGAQMFFYGQLKAKYVLKTCYIFHVMITECDNNVGI